MKRNRSRSRKTTRFSLPEDEKHLPWLSRLLDAYHAVDRGVAASIMAEQNKGRILACARGCSNCCKTHQDIPLYPLELQGLIWYVTERCAGPEREALKTSLMNFQTGDGCPFLMRHTCAVHPVRPMACRQFNVFGKPCDEGEDPFHTRRYDVMDPVKKYVDQAFFIMLPYHGISKESERISFIETGKMHTMVRELHRCNWRALAEKIDRKDQNKD